MAEPYLALGLTGTAVLRLLDDPQLRAEWDDLPLAFSILGIDRLDGRSGPTEVIVDGSAAAAVLLARTVAARVLVPAPPRRDHPYNLARRVASLGHLSTGRSGVVFGPEDHAGASGDPWSVSTGGVAADTSPAGRAVAAARAVRALERSWPLDSVVGDRESGIFVRSDEIEHVDVEGVFRIAGPLTVPEPPHGPSVIGWYAAGEHDPEADDAVDLVIGGNGPVPVVEPGEPLPGDATGVVLASRADTDLTELLSTARRWLADGARATERSQPLRAALSLPAPPRDRGRPAFAVPQPHPWL